MTVALDQTGDCNDARFARPAATFDGALLYATFRPKHLFEYKS